MGTSAPPALSKSDNDTRETLLEFPDNRLLIDLCGAYDRNLARLEHDMDVQIARRGNRLVVIGDESDRELTAQVLTELYERLEDGASVEVADIDAAVRMSGTSPSEPARPASGTQAQAGDGALMIRTRKKVVEPRTHAQRGYVEALLDHELAFGIGPAGTGKTYLAVAVAVAMFIEGRVDRIILSRPAVEAGERLGFLPGDMKEKVDPYMQPLYDALHDFMPGKQLAKLMEERRIEIAPLAFMRGRTLSRAFVVLDEAQNASAMQMKMFLTRLGEESRMVVTGDRTQVDLPRGITSGLGDAERILKNVRGVSFTYFSAGDVVRHPLVARIIEAYGKDDAAPG